MATNSTSDLHAPGTQLSVADIIVITVYFALNVAVGIWVRGTVVVAPNWALRVGAWDGNRGPACPVVSALVPPGGLVILWSSSQPGADLLGDLDQAPFSIWVMASPSVK